MYGIDIKSSRNLKLQQKRRQRRLLARMVVMLIVQILMFFVVPVQECRAQTDNNAQFYGGDLSDYDFDAIDEQLKEAAESLDSAYIEDFEQLVTDIISGENNAGGIGDKLLEVFVGIFTDNRKAVMQIILLAVLSAAVNSFTPLFNKDQISDIAKMIIEISLISILIASFYTACTLCVDTLESCIGMYKAIVPVFFMAVTVASGSITTGAYYEVILIMISFITSILKNVLIKLIKIYMFFVMADSVTGKERFSRIRELIPTAIKWACKLAIVIFTGIGGIKGLINPMTDAVKKNVIYKSLKLLPGIGTTVETVSETVWGAGIIIKNGIGVAAVIVLIAVCIIPIGKLFALTMLFKITAAAIEPIADKKLVKAVNGTSIAISSLTVITMVTLSLFILMVAIICISTNYR